MDLALHLPKDEYKTFVKNSYIIYPKKARSASIYGQLPPLTDAYGNPIPVQGEDLRQKYINDLRTELLTRINSTKRNAADRFFKRKDEIDKALRKRYAI